MRLRDLLSEGWDGMRQRPARAILASGGTIIGSAALVATLGLTATVRANVAQRFDAYAATTVTLDAQANNTPIPSQADLNARLHRLPGIRAVGTLRRVDVREAVAARWGSTGVELPVYALSARANEVVEPNVTDGGWFTSFMASRGERVALVASSVMDEFGLASPDRSPAIFVGSIALTVVGVYDDVRRYPETLLGIVVPEATAAALWPRGSSNPPAIIIATEPAASTVVARQAAIAVSPANPELFEARPVLDPRRLRGEVDQDVASLFLALGGVALLVGVLGAANTTMIGVIQRTGEIGLRRSIGASRPVIALQFLAESGWLGAVGGVIGVSLGTLIVAVVARAWELPPTIDPRVAALGPVVGTLAGVIAGAYPALRAARTHPADALRSS